MNVKTGQAVAVLALVFGLGAGAAATSGATQPAKGTAPAKPGAGDAGDADAKAAEAYKTKCSMCHAMDGNSPLPNMSFADGVWKHGTTVKEMVATISNGVPGTAMMPFKTQFTPEEIEALARYVRKFDKKLK